MSQASSTDKPLAKPSPAKAEPTARIALAKLDFLMVVAFLGLTFLLGVFPLKDTDFWWHLKAGDLIRSEGKVPTVDTFTFGAEDRPWVDLHWGFQVALSWGYEHGGVVLLNLAKCVITCLSLFLLITARKRDWPIWLMLLAWLPALLVLSGRMYIRPETVSLLYLSMVLAILFRWDRNPWLAFALPLVQVCWVNTQGLFAFEPILIGLALVDQVIRPGSFATERRGWWMKVLPAIALTGVACFCNPYGATGAFYPLQLAETMRNPIFKKTILELEPLSSFVEKVGLDNLMLQIQLFVFVLGAASFVLPLLWFVWVRLVDLGRTTSPESPPAKGKGSKKTRKKGKPDALPPWSPWLFRGLLFGFFSGLSVLASRNSHQFAAITGAVTAWNFGDWAGMIRARRLRLDPSADRVRVWPRLLTLGLIVLVIGLVGSGKFYAWAGEGRTIALGEEPLWFPKEAVKFAGGEGMPDRAVIFHNGHASLYEYEFAPKKKVYTDARLEVMGEKIYTDYINLSKKISEKSGDWSGELEAMGRPAVLVDNLQIGNSSLSATLLNSRRWRCVYYDPMAAVFVHESLTKIVDAHAVDFAARHFHREANRDSSDPTTLAAMARSLRLLGSDCHARGDNVRSIGLFLLGLDYARKEREVDPQALDGWKNAGLIDFSRELLGSPETIPRFRLPFDPVFDLAVVRGTYLLQKALEIDPNDPTIQFYLINSLEKRGMDEQVLPLWEKYVKQPNKNAIVRRQKDKAAEEIARLRSKLGKTPPTTWANRAELEPLVNKLLYEGRASTAAEVMETAYRPEARPWEWADRLAVLRLHLGEPAKARAAWQAAATDVPEATRKARVAVTYMIESDFENARRSFQEAIATDPRSFEAHYGLAILEQDAGFADEALSEAKQAEKLAPNVVSRDAAHAIVKFTEPYAKKTKP